MQQVSNMFIYNFTKQSLKTSKNCSYIENMCWILLGELAFTPEPDPIAKRLVPLALGIFFLPFPVLYIRNLKLCPWSNYENNSYRNKKNSHFGTLFQMTGATHHVTVDP